MPKINAKFVENKPFFPGLVGEIVAAEEVKTAVSGYNGVRCRIKGDNEIEYGEMLWIRAEVGTKSKLGAFMSVFGSDTDLWLKKRVRILRWADKDRDVEEVPEKAAPKVEKKNKAEEVSA